MGTVLDTIPYTYGDSDWGDLLTSYDGRTISYDSIGNPLSDGQRTYTWEHGRELATVTQDEITWTNTYGADGLRTKRTDGTTTYRYRYTAGQLATMNINDDVEMWFMYDDNGPLVIKYGNAESHKVYHYELNLQGDVMAIISTTGERVVEYTYDAWGNVLSITGSAKDTIGVHNPLRYRGYIYDHETLLYYCQSRYYNPEMGRWLNADALAATGQGMLGNNMFTYCLNNPVNYVDPTGTLAYPGEIHNEVVRRIADKYGYNKEQFILYEGGGFGRADLISPDGQVWDVKRDKPRQIKAGKRQVQKYVENTWARSPDTPLSVGENEIESDFFYYKSGLTTYKVTYRYAGDGVIAYDYKVSEFDYQTLSSTLVVVGVVALVGIAAGLPSGALAYFAFA